MLITERGAAQELLPGFDDLLLKCIKFKQDYYPHREFSLEIEDKKSPVIYNQFKAEDYAKTRMKLVIAGEKSWQPLVVVQ